jgi:hypothetical protein
MAINVSKLHQELVAAGVPVVSVHINGTVDYADDPTPEEITLTGQIIAAHDPTDYVELRRKQAILLARAIPGWATFTPGQMETAITNGVLGGYDQTGFDAWVDANVTVASLATLKAVTKLLGHAILDLRTAVILLSKMILALRDYDFAELRGQVKDN